jgi:hypothetical protein
MANEQNLKPLNTRTKSEQRKIAKMGGIKSGEVRQARKTLKEELLLLLDKDDNQTNLTVSLIQKALAGDTKAFEIIRDTIGEKPTDKQEIGNIDDKPLNINLKAYSLEELKELIKNEDKG